MSEQEEQKMIEGILAYKAEQPKMRRQYREIPPLYDNASWDRVLGRKPVAARSLPIERRARMTLSGQALRVYRREKRLCRDCGVSLSMEDVSRCAGCKKKHREYERRYEERVARPEYRVLREAR